MWVYAVVAIGFVAVLLLCHGIVELLCRKEELKLTMDANAHLIARNRKLEAENRRLASQLSSKEYQVNSRWELRHEEDQAQIRKLEQELKVKDALLKAMEGKLAV